MKISIRELERKIERTKNTLASLQDEYLNMTGHLYITGNEINQDRIDIERRRAETQ